MRRSAEVLVFLLLFPGLAHAAAAPVTTCGQSVADGYRGILQNDLTCPGGRQAIRLGSGSTLDLNGHTITVEGACRTATTWRARRSRSSLRPARATAA